MRTPESDLGAPGPWGAVPAVLSQFVASGGSLLLQVLAARSLGAAGYGGYTLFLSVLVVATAIQTAWVGDALTVFDRHAPAVRRSLLRAHAVFTVLGFAAGAGGAIVLGVAGGWTAVLMGLAIAVWITEEAGRRLFMARLEFWKLVVNDAVYVVAALVTLAVLATRGSLDLGSFAVAIVTGSAVAVIAAAVALARSPRVPGPAPSGAAPPVTAGAVARFGGWRSAQAAIRPLSLLGLRVVISLVTSRAALGRVEAARLLVAPAITLVNGAGSFLLPTFTRRHTRRDVRRASLALAAVCAASGLAAVAAADPLAELLTGGAVSVDRLAVASWALFALAFGVGVPPALALVARRRSRTVFLVRTGDSILGLALAAVLVAVAPAAAAPAGVAVGMLAGAALLFRCLHKEAVL